MTLGSICLVSCHYDDKIIFGLYGNNVSFFWELIILIILCQLQKYRLHTRRPSPSIHHNNGNAQTPQIVVVGGIWVPTPEYAAVATTSAPLETSTVTAANEIYAPVAAPPLASPQATTSLTKRPQQKQPKPSDSEERVSHSQVRVHCNSPSTSSSTHTTTTSPVF